MYANSNMVVLYGYVTILELNNVQVHNKGQFIRSITNRPKNEGLITVSNHKSCIDDPCIFCKHFLHFMLSKSRLALLPWSCFTSARQWKWTPAAHELLFENKLLAWIFGRGHVVPVIRGVGRLIAEAKNLPSVLPMWHVGMDDILPNYKPYIPRIGKKVTLLIGAPLHISSLLENLKSQNRSTIEIRKAITDLIQEEMLKLKAQAELLHTTSHC